MHQLGKIRHEKSDKSFFNCAHLLKMHHKEGKEGVPSKRMNSCHYEYLFAKFTDLIRHSDPLVKLMHNF